MKKGDAVSHLLGTMHLGFDYQELPPEIWAELSRSRAVALEVDLRQAGVGFADRATLPPGEALSTRLGAETWQRLVATLDDFPPAQLDRLQPWAVVNLLFARMFPTAVPLDLAVVREAERAERELVFLETLEQQLALLARVMDADAVTQLLDEASPMRRLLAVGVAAYQKGDAETLSASVLDPAGYGGDPEVMDLFLFARNRAWVDKLLPELSRGGMFVAVGAAHLVGDEGLVAQLEKHGFEVTRAAKP